MREKQYQDDTSVPLHLLFIVTITIIILAAFLLAFIYATTPCAFQMRRAHGFN